MAEQDRAGAGVESYIKDLLSGNDEPDPGGDLEGAMKQVSLVLSLIGLALMVTGLVLMLLSGATFSSTEAAALAPFPLSAWARATPGLAVTSAGIILLSLLPIVRVLLALRLYLRGQDLRDAAATVVVLLELLLSIRVGG